MNLSDPKTNHRSKLTGCLLVLAVPVLLIAVLLIILFANNRPASVMIPTPKTPSPNGYDDFIAATKHIGSIRSPLSDTSRPIDAWTVPQYEAFVRDNAQAMALVRAGLQKDCLTPPTRDLAGYDYASFARLRELARIMAGESLYYLKIGQYGKAADSCLDVMELGVAFPHGGPLMHALIGGAVETIGAHYLPEALAKLNPEELAQAAARLEKIQARRVSYSDIVTEEGYSSVATMANITRMTTSMATPTFSQLLLAFTPPPSTSATAPPPNIWSNIRYAFSNKNAGYKQALAYYAAVAEDQKGYYTGKVNVRRPSNPMCSIIIDSSMITKSRSFYCRAQAITTMLQAETALRRYKADNGSYPASLKALTPKYLKKTPVDPFGQGNPLCYKPLNNNQDFLLYSRGEDLKDDGGKGDPWTSKKKTKDLIAAN